MSKPKFWRVFFGDKYADFSERARARGFAMIRKSQGDTVKIEAIL